MFRLRPYQNKAKSNIYQAWQDGHKNVLLVLPTGAGKCLGKDTPVLLHNGVVKMVQDVKVGDYLMGPDSMPRRVLSTCRGESEMFRINPVKGDSWTCNDVHVLTLKHTRSKDIVDIPLDQYMDTTKTFKHTHKQFRVGVEMAAQDLPIEPYLLGLYLRDNRWIPDVFLRNSRDNRLELLAGLLDGDGHMTHKGFEIITKHKQLSNDILYLCRSLGLAAYCSEKIGRIKSINFEGLYYRVYISGPTDMIPNKIPREKAGPRLQKKDVLNTGFEVEPIGQGDYFGFTLSGDGRFLLGDFTVTHNTVTFCSLAIELAVEAHDTKPTAIAVHRKELVQQISLTLSSQNITHNIIAPRPTIKDIVAGQRREFGKQFYDYNSSVTVVSVDTLNSRITQHEKWAKGIRFWVTDEAAHLLRKNKWGRAVSYFDNAIGLGVTATPERLDKRGLGSHVDGVFDTMVEGPNTRWLIDNGFLCKYKIAVPSSDYQAYLAKASSGSDYSKSAMSDASAKSTITGDVVENYKKFADGKQAIVFATDIANAHTMQENFNDAGISAKLLTGLTSNTERLQGMIDFREKRTKVLINVDLFDEGLDVPGIECVIMARPTMSLSKYLQMIGRGLRTAEGKEFLIVIDHVGNVSRHGLPCQKRKWTLDRIVKRRDNTNLIRICSNVECNSPYDRMLTECPWCGEPPVSKAGGGGGGRIPPEMVDGDLELIDPFTLQEMESNTILESPGDIAERVSGAAGAAAGIRAAKNQKERIEVQGKLSEVIARWAGHQRHYGYTDRQIHKKFFIEYQMTITQALAEPKKNMLQTIEMLGEEE